MHLSLATDRTGGSVELFERVGEKVRCLACARRCLLKEGQVGLCGVRANRKGGIDLLVYGRVAALHVDPVEKKPLSHFRPGSRVLSLATTGCNWVCRYCQNYFLSQRRVVEGEEISPERIVEVALSTSSQGIAYTYNQPSIFLEFARDIGTIARSRGLFNTFVSNGYDTPEGVKVMGTFLDAITVDFKGNGEESFLRKYVGVPSAEPIFETLALLKKEGIHVEVTDLVVPRVGDNLDSCRRLARRVLDILGPDVPLHFLRFHPDYLMRDLPETPVETLEEHARVARSEGLRFVYVGNVWGHPWESTYCPQCGEILVERYGFSIWRWNLRGSGGRNSCPSCGEGIPIVGTMEPSWKERRFFPVEVI